MTLVDFILGAGRGASVLPDMLEGWSKAGGLGAGERGRERGREEGRTGKRRPVAAGGKVLVVVGRARQRVGRQAGQVGNLERGL